MTDSSGDLRQKLTVASDLHGVVRTMKAMAASSIGKYERAVSALADYDRTVKLGLAAALRGIEWQSTAAKHSAAMIPPNVIVFGSDQGLVGQFNEVIADFCMAILAKLPGPAVVWAVGERVHARLDEAGVPIRGLLPVPNDVSGISALVRQLLVQAEGPGTYAEQKPLYVFHNAQTVGAVYQPRSLQLLPLDRAWRDAMIANGWANKCVPELLADPEVIVRALVREYLFISLYKTCAESLAGENASRLAAMQRAEKNIDELTQDLMRRFHRVRQTSIDEELFDVVSGFQADQEEGARRRGH